MRRAQLVLALTGALIMTAGCTAIVDSSGLTDEYDAPVTRADSGSPDTSEIADETAPDTSVGDVIDAPPPDSSRDCEQKIRDGVRYLLCKDELMYEEAEIVCAAEFKSRLVVIHDAEKQAFLHAWLFARNRAWIGLDDRKVDLTFVWADGSKPTYLNWRTGPSPEDWSDCVWMETGGTWEDKMCNNSSIRAWYFCEG
jgi:hypothetical protein